MSTENNYLLIGHFTKDLKGNGFKIGGTVYYSGLAAKKLGKKVKIITSFGEDISKEKTLKEFEIKNVPSKNTTTFLNVYKGDKRSQFLFKKAKKILPNNIPENWRKSEIIHLAPVAQELNEKIFYSSKSSLVGLSLQGFLRDKDKNGKVFFSLWKDYKKFLPLTNVAVLSEEDIKKDLGLAKEMAKFSKILVLTLGDRGCQVFQNNKIRDFSTKKIKISDNTGAGDAFTAAYLINFEKTKSPFEAAKFANSFAHSFLKEKIS